MRIVAIDLEGTGPQDADDEAILEIALVPLAADLEPDMTSAFTTLLNPGRLLSERTWISPGITDATLSCAPLLRHVQPQVAALIDGAHLVGHSVRVDWNLLRRKLPGLRPAGLLDTLRLARARNGPSGNGLGNLVARYGLTEAVTRRVPGGKPHRALWDAVACALLLAKFKAAMDIRTLATLASAAEVEGKGIRPEPEQPSLFA